MEQNDQIMTVSQAALWLKAERRGDDVGLLSVSIDTRTLTPGALFFALEGPNFDGHEFLAQAKSRGAVAAVVHSFQPVDLPQIKVDDTAQALALLAQQYRQQFAPKVIAITGSCGKTTTRSLLESIVSKSGSVLATHGNYNNHYGVPLMLFRLRAHHQYLVLELGADSVGEIAHLSSLVQPHVGVVTLAARAHIETFGSLEGVAKGKGELFSSLPANGVAVINADDAFYSYWSGLLDQQDCITFGLKSGAQVTANEVEVLDNQSIAFSLHLPDGSLWPVCLPLLGQHNVMNALAAAAAANAIGIKPEAIVSGLASAHAVGSRMKPKTGLKGATIVDDTYNANPCSVNAAIETLVGFSGKRVLVLGDMLELGANAVKWHQEVGEHAVSLGVDRLLGFGDLAGESVRAFGPDGVHFQSQELLIEALKKELDDATVVMVKGSRSLSMDRVVSALSC